MLWDDGYTDRAGVLSEPVTWVLDRRGRMVFTFEVPSGDWGQEVGWMVEAVLEGKEGAGGISLGTLIPLI